MSSLLSVAVSAEESAPASPRDRALVFWDQAREALDAGEEERAVTLLRQSVQQAPLGRALCDLGRTLRRTGEVEEAARWLQRCSQQDDVSEAERARAAAEAQHLRDMRGDVVLRGGTAGAELLVDGEPVGQLPLEEPLTLPPGRRELTVLVDGEATTRFVEVRPAASTTVELGEALTTARRQVPRWTVWTMAAFTLATLAGAVAAYAVDLRYRADDEQDRAQRASLAAGILGGFAGAGLAVTVTLIPYLAPRRNRRSALRLDRSWTIAVRGRHE